MTLPNLYADATVQLAQAQTIATFPVNTFLENLTVAPTGEIFVTSHEAGEIITLDREQKVGLYTKLDGKVTGIAMVRDNSFLVNGWNTEGISFVAILAGGEVQFLHTLPEAIFLNGITPLTADQYLIADSYRGAIWSFDLKTQTSNIWLEHPLLARDDNTNPFPGANGLKRLGDHLYVSNTQQKLLVRIPLDVDQMPQTPEVFVKNTNLDDFAFDIHGNLYGTTHVYNSVVRIDRDRNTTIIAQADQGVTGCTAVAFYGTGLYVVNNGGMSYPPPEGVEPAQIVRLEVGVEGAPLLSAG